MSSIYAGSSFVNIELLLTLFIEEILTKTAGLSSIGKNCILTLTVNLCQSSSVPLAKS
ncbi:MAG: hypothetical protein WA919_23965 [Coleofasciculaceae cyanobacterium]